MFRFTLAIATASGRRRITTPTLSTPILATHSSASRPVLRLQRQNIFLNYYHTSKMSTVGPVVALSHGGGPMPILGDPGHDSIIYSLKNRVPKILKLGTPEQPRAIVVVTAHWSTAKPTISSAASHNLLYDYYGFPPESYQLQYPAPGSPEIARELHDALATEGLASELDDERGWDHGVFIPLLLVNPKADIPIVQLSVLESEDPEQHIRMGKALARLRASNVAIIGSGFASFHNLGIMRALSRASASQQAEFRAASDEWNGALTGAASKEDVSERWRTLEGWRKFPHADMMHPPQGGEHFMPLLVCAGASMEGEQTRRYADEFVGVEINTYYWGAETVA
ncbi:Extradiol ring-cleavage dioxygenase, class III enzyme, subunit B [Mariannaea sp. PMI_226]|nr:Extradiol ring-cleavage dioxygenase, class III enzyme, subunit B [Mariannaea sp. PMI_226]